MLTGQSQQAKVDTVRHLTDTLKLAHVNGPSAENSGDNEDLKDQLQDLEERLISFESNRDYTSHILTIIGIFFALIIGISTLLGFYIVPRRQKKDYEAFASGFEKRFEDVERKIYEALINANRAHYAIKAEKSSHMTVVWCGRWLEAIYNAGRDIYDEHLQRDIRTILRRTKEILDSHSGEELTHLKRFPSKDGVIKNFEVIASHDNKEIKKIATDILQYLLHLWYDDGKDTDGPKGVPYTPHAPGATGA